MIKKITIILTLLISIHSYSQEVFPFQGYLGHLKSFQNGQVRQVDYLEPIDIKYSEEIIAFVDSKNDLMVYDGQTKEKLTGLANDYKIGINIVAWNTGPVIYVWDDGQKSILTYFGGRYAVSDSLIVFEDTRDNAIRTYYKGKIYDLYTSIGSPVFPIAVGSNTVAFKGNGNNYYVFIAGKIIEIGVYNSAIKLAAGANVVAFNDPFHQTFAAVFKNGVFNVETIPVENYKTGYGIIVYTDQNNNLIGYINGEIYTLSTFPSFYNVFRNTVVWGENGVFYTFYNGKRFEITNYIPSNYKIRNGIIAFRNQVGGVEVYYDGKVKTITNIQQTPFYVNGNMVKVEVNTGDYLFFKEGEIYHK